MRLTTPVTPATVFLSSRQIRDRFGGRGAKWIARQMEGNGFPKPVRFGDGRLLYWRLADIEEWESREAREVA